MKHFILIQRNKIVVFITVSQVQVHINDNSPYGAVFKMHIQIKDFFQFFFSSVQSREEQIPIFRENGT